MAPVAARLPKAKLQRVARRDQRHETQPVPLRHQRRSLLLPAAPRLPARNVVVGATTLRDLRHGPEAFRASRVMPFFVDGLG
jgi:hypothetical protein